MIQTSIIVAANTNVYIYSCFVVTISLKNQTNLIKVMI